MDTQLKKGLLEICVLVALRRGGSYGYKIVRDISPYIGISELTLYSILRRLEDNECLSIYSVEYHRRLRRYYRITNVDISRIQDLLMEWQSTLHIYEFIEGGDKFE